MLEEAVSSPKFLGGCQGAARGAALQGKGAGGQGWQQGQQGRGLTDKGAVPLRWNKASRAGPAMVTRVSQKSGECQTSL